MASLDRFLVPPAHHLPLLPHLCVVPALLAVATAVALFVHSDVNAALLWSQCHARARLPLLTGSIPVVGTPLCFLLSFFKEALDSSRSRAVMGVVLAYVGALLTVSTLEAARRCHRRAIAVIRRPTGWWLLFNLIGGAFVWQLVVVPAFMHRAKAWFAIAGAEDADDDADLTVPDAEAVAIPVAVALGFYLPAALMLAFHSPATIGVWLFFPVYVSVIRHALRWSLERSGRFERAAEASEPATVRVESRHGRAAAVYGLPILCAVVAHVFALVNLTTGGDDRKEMTRSTITFLEVDTQFVALTVLYWVFVEVGWRAPLAMVCAGVVLGPGAGLCLGWLYREKLLQAALDGRDGEGVEDEAADERTRLLP
ncbi:hypothetical protein DCS_01947 [Drechmeria coniospora]|uniref:Corticosteroid-binding protein n=1 Tax=Drechmeria coniospora TaxID=98403 RepID=A0A151GUM3_DRECN|nr:hypothetical protein DCS_01947 [Drechmeria coniospora]KYK60809.1 hypothetical protein DCS_01947 [Drechmeria coniospora]ODA83504.1 hypothetical protein RJ55_02018 [Drechmeria coniospora]